MSVVYSILFNPQQLGVTNSTLIIVPSLFKLRNGRVRIANFTASGATAKLWAVPAGGLADNTNICLPTVTIAANSYIDVDLPVIGDSGKLIALGGTASSLIIHQMDGFYQS